MQAALKRTILHQAEEHWKAARVWEAGKTLFEHIARADRPRWTAQVLELAYRYIPPAAEIDAVLDLAQHPERWGEDQRRAAHQIVDAVNDLQQQLPEPLTQGVFALATNAAKVTYNAYSFAAPFDHSAGWEIVPNIKQIVTLVHEPAFTVQAWSRLCDEHYITITDPIMCHPGCPICYVNGLTPGSKAHRHLK
jgi:hypothetical protein